jgi:putative DNA primase/helicase
MNPNPSFPENNESTTPPTNNPESNLLSSDKQSNSLSSKNTSSVSSHLENMTSLVSSTLINLLAPDPKESEAHYKTRSRERHAQEFSDIANAHRFVSHHCDRLRYIPQSNSWMFWDGQRWSPDPYNNIIHPLARATIQSFRDEALALPYEERQRSERLFDHADRSDTPKRLQAMLDLASQDPALIASPDIFDSDPLLLNVLNGTIDLRTNRLLPPNSQDFLTHLAPVTYDPAACSPAWDKFLLDITNQDPALQHFLQLAVGYSLTGSLQEQAIFLLYGSGSNGKSTFLNAIGSLLGDYTGHASHNLVTTRSSTASSSPLPTSLLHKRLLIIPELGPDRTFDTYAMMQITDSIPLSLSANANHLSSPQSTHCFKLWMTANELPTIRDYTLAAWRRIRLIHFPVSFWSREDKQLTTKLQVSASAILNWALQGCLTWQREGLSLPTTIQQATTCYQDEQDELACFLRTCCQFNPNHSIKASNLYQAYRLWYQQTGENNPLTANAFGRQILAHGYHREHRMTGSFYLGFSLITPPSSQPNVILENQRITYHDFPYNDGL